MVHVSKVFARVILRQTGVALCVGPTTLFIQERWLRPSSMYGFFKKREKLFRGPCVEKVFVRVILRQHGVTMVFTTNNSAEAGNVYTARIHAYAFIG